MNSLIFNPEKSIIEEWAPLYFTSSQLTEIVHLVQETNMYIQFIQHQDCFEHQSHIGSKKHDKEISSRDKQLDSEDNFGLKSKKNFDSHLNLELDAIIQMRKKKKINNLMTDLLKIRSEINLKVQVQQAHRVGTHKALNIPVQRYDSQILRSSQQNLKIYHKKLVQMKNLVVEHLTDSIQEEKIIIQTFTQIKLRQMTHKLALFAKIRHVLPNDKRNIILYSNIFIETYNLTNFLTYNRQILTNFTKESTDFTGYNLSYNQSQVKKIIKSTVEKIQELITRTHVLQAEIRDIYFRSIKLKKNRIRDSYQLQKEIIKDIAVNSQEFTPATSSTTFVSGIAFGLILFALILTLIVRFLSDSFQEDAYYLENFRVWRGASYMLYFNWILAFVFYLCEKFKLNYKLLLLQGDCYIPRPQSFFLSAAVMTAVYLILFGLFIINELKIIDIQGLHLLGYYQWIFNVVFLLNPLKIINYEGRRYYLTIFLKLMIAPFRKFNFKVYLLSLLFSSWTQPFSDFSYTVCKAIYASNSTCNFEARLATYIFTLAFPILRIILALKAHFLLKSQKCLTRPMIAVINNFVVMNNATASFVYNYFLTTGTLIYWIASAALATISGLNTDFRADWGLITFDVENCFLRKYLHFPNVFYYVVMGINVVLILGWVLTISNNTADGLGINMMYFLMILSYVELARRGMWLFIRIEELQTVNSSMYRTMQPDDFIYDELRTEILNNHMKKQNPAFQLHESDMNFNIEHDIENLKIIVQKKQAKQTQSKLLLKNLKEALNDIHETHDPIQ